ncbi:hypothetical protein D3C77_464480 [compost metagenome]
MHHPGHARHFSNQCTLQAHWRWLLDPVDTEVFEADGWRQFFSNNERMLRGRIAAALAIGHRSHGRYANFMQTRNRLPFLASAQHWQLGSEQVLEDLTPADATVDLDEVATPLDFGAQGATAFKLAVYLALQALHGIECIAPSPQALERLGQYQFHLRSWARITSAACSGML